MPELLGLVSLPESALLLILFVSSHLKLVTPDLIKSRTGVRAHQVIISLDLLNEEARIQRVKKTGLLVPTLVYISRRKGFLASTGTQDVKMSCVHPSVTFLK